MKDLTKKQLDRQDLVDNAIYRMLIEVNPNKKPIKWDAEMIGRVRDTVVELFLEYKVCADQRFYPFLVEESTAREAQ